MRFEQNAKKRSHVSKNRAALDTLEDMLAQLYDSAGSFKNDRAEEKFNDLANEIYYFVSKLLD